MIILRKSGLGYIYRNDAVIIIYFVQLGMATEQEKIRVQLEIQRIPVKSQAKVEYIETENPKGLTDSSQKIKGREEILIIEQLTNALKEQVCRMCSIGSEQCYWSSYQFQSQVISNHKISLLIDSLKDIEAFRCLQKGIKDRKTSFFRLVLKHLKKTMKAKKRKIPSDFPTYQKRLNMNSICSEMISDLYLRHGQKILAYLRSPKFREDLITKNKSKTNKLFYLLHLDSIIYEAEKGKIHEFPFFQLDPLSEQVRRVIRVLRLKYSEEKPQQTVKITEKDNEICENNLKIQEEGQVYIYGLNLPYIFQPTMTKQEKQIQ